MSQAGSRERICRRAVVPADTLLKAVMRGRRAPGIIRRPYQSFSSGHLRTPHMARTGMREGVSRNLLHFRRSRGPPCLAHLVEILMTSLSSRLGKKISLDEWDAQKKRDQEVSKTQAVVNDL